MVFIPKFIGRNGWKLVYLQRFYRCKCPQNSTLYTAQCTIISHYNFDLIFFTSHTYSTYPTTAYLNFVLVYTTYQKLTMVEPEYFLLPRPPSNTLITFTSLRQRPCGHCSCSTILHSPKAYFSPFSHFNL